MNFKVPISASTPGNLNFMSYISVSYSFKNKYLTYAERYDLIKTVTLVERSSRRSPSWVVAGG